MLAYRFTEFRSESFFNRSDLPCTDYTHNSGLALGADFSWMISHINLDPITWIVDV